MTELWEEEVEVMFMSGADKIVLEVLDGYV